MSQEVTDQARVEQALAAMREFEQTIAQLERERWQELERLVKEIDGEQAQTWRQKIESVFARVFPTV